MKWTENWNRMSWGKGGGEWERGGREERRYDEELGEEEWEKKGHEKEVDELNGELKKDGMRRMTTKKKKAGGRGRWRSKQRIERGGGWAEEKEEDNEEEEEKVDEEVNDELKEIKCDVKRKNKQDIWRQCWENCSDKMQRYRRDKCSLSDINGDRRTGQMMTGRNRGSQYVPEQSKCQ